MLQDTSSAIRPFNNDNTPHFAMFQARLQAAQARQASHDSAAGAASAASAVSVGSAARPLSSQPPRPSQLNEGEAQSALHNVQAEAAQQNATLVSVHKGLDPERVARLLGLLE